VQDKDILVDLVNVGLKSEQVVSLSLKGRSIKGTVIHYII